MSPRDPNVTWKIYDTATLYDKEIVYSGGFISGDYPRGVSVTVNNPQPQLSSVNDIRPNMGDIL
jgi:hypothetical protein